MCDRRFSVFSMYKSCIVCVCDTDTTMVHTYRKSIYSLQLEKYFVKSSFITLMSRNFCEKIVELKFHHQHSVQCAQCGKT